MSWLPISIDRRVRFFAWASLAVQLLIVLTGGLVRLTASGLGCPTWPQCTEGSFVTTPEMGIHGLIEFGNRTLFFVIQIVAIITFLLVVRMRRERRDLFWLALVPCFSIVLQAVLGGVTVLTGLNPYVVGLHFLASAVLVVLAAVLVYRVYYGPRAGGRVVPLWYAIATHLASLLVAVTVLLGIVTTGSGPHAGDHGAARNGLDSELLQHLHSWPAYAATGASILLLIGAFRLRIERLQKFTALLVSVEVAQVAVGLSQARLGLPEPLVAAHMVLACCLAAAMAAVVLSLRGPAAETSTTGSAATGPRPRRGTAASGS